MSSFLEKLVDIEDKEAGKGTAATNLRGAAANLNNRDLVTTVMDEDEIIFFVFKYQDEPIPVSIMIDGYNLERMSTMRNVLLNKVGDEPCIDEKYSLELDGTNSKKVYFKIQLNRGELVLNKSQFLMLTVRKILAFKNLSDLITIHIITSFE